MSRFYSRDKWWQGTEQKYPVKPISKDALHAKKKERQEFFHRFVAETPPTETNHDLNYYEAFQRIERLTSYYYERQPNRTRNLTATEIAHRDATQDE